jgi:secreted PhoX family phosphatase
MSKELDTRPDTIPSPMPAGASFDAVLQQRLSRRQVLGAGFGMASASVLASLGLVACGDDKNSDSGDAQAALLLGFTAVNKSLADRVVIPTGYSAQVLYALGDPIKDGIAAYLNDGSDTDMDQRSGDHHDGMSYFGLDSNGNWDPKASDRGLLCINHEAITIPFLHAAGASGNPRPEAESLKELYAHGVSVVEIQKAGSAWSVNRSSTKNRRIHPLTEMEISGPARGTKFMVTSYSPTGVNARGTVNNCANGYTPWGTYLTCEENWNGYFYRAAGDYDNLSTSEKSSAVRYGLTASTPTNAKTSRHGWETSTPTGSTPADAFARWNLTKTGSSSDGSGDFRNEANTFGWVVEIDPFDPASKPKKRTALGRFVHEGAWPGKPIPGQPVVFYMGDDNRGDYIYKFVSDAMYDPDDTGLAAGDKYLDRGTLYVAKFNADGSGEWLPLEHGFGGLNEDNLTYPFTSQAAVLVNARLAADVLGATKMDRPEWAAVHPQTGEVYLALTNNSRRGTSSNQPVDAANPRSYDAQTDGNADLDGNVNGHIIRWREAGGDGAATSFTWDIFLFGARASAPSEVNQSGLVDSNDFSSPDGLWFDPRGVLWIQTDDGAYTDVTNCMMLAGVPGSVGDGGPVTIGAQTTFVGKQLPAADLRRFLVGPPECEITGIDMTPDGKTMFVNIQHPGEVGGSALPASFSSHWPLSTDATADAAASSARPRSATLVITRDDGGVIGL